MDKSDLANFLPLEMLQNNNKTTTINSNNFKSAHTLYVKPTTLNKIQYNFQDSLRDAVFNTAVWFIVCESLLGEHRDIGVLRDSSTKQNIGGLWGMLYDMPGYNNFSTEVQVSLKRGVLAGSVSALINLTDLGMKALYDPIINAPLSAVSSKKMSATENPIPNIRLNAIKNILEQISKIKNPVPSDDITHEQILKVDNLNQQNFLLNDDIKDFLLTAIDRLNKEQKKEIIEKCKDLKIEVKQNEDAKSVFKKYLSKPIEQYTQPFCGGFDEFICNFSELVGPAITASLANANTLSMGFLLFATFFTGYTTNQYIANKKLDARRDDVLNLNLIKDPNPFISRLKNNFVQSLKDAEKGIKNTFSLQTISNIIVDTACNVPLRLSAELPYVWLAKDLENIFGIECNPNIGAGNLPAAIANTNRGVLGNTIFSDIKVNARQEVDGKVDALKNNIINSFKPLKDKMYNLFEMDISLNHKLSELEKIKEDSKYKLGLFLTEDLDVMKNPKPLLQYILDTDQLQYADNIDQSDYQLLKSLLNANDKALKYNIQEMLNRGERLLGDPKNRKIENQGHGKAGADLCKALYHAFNNRKKIVDSAKLYYYAIDFEIKYTKTRIEQLREVIRQKQYKYYKDPEYADLTIEDDKNNLSDLISTKFDKNYEKINKSQFDQKIQTIGDEKIKRIKKLHEEIQQLIKEKPNNDTDKIIIINKIADYNKEISNISSTLTAQQKRLSIKTKDEKRDDLKQYMYPEIDYSIENFETKMQQTEKEHQEKYDNLNGFGGKFLRNIEYNEKHNINVNDKFIAQIKKDIINGDSISNTAIDILLSNGDIDERYNKSIRNTISINDDNKHICLDVYKEIVRDMKNNIDKNINLDYEVFNQYDSDIELKCDTILRNDMIKYFKNSFNKLSEEKKYILEHGKPRSMGDIKKLYINYLQLSNNIQDITDKLDNSLGDYNIKKREELEQFDRQQVLKQEYENRVGFSDIKHIDDYSDEEDLEQPEFIKKFSLTNQNLILHNDSKREEEQKYKEILKPVSPSDIKIEDCSSSDSHHQKIIDEQYKQSQDWFAEHHWLDYYKHRWLDCKPNNKTANNQQNVISANKKSSLRVKN